MKGLVEALWLMWQGPISCEEEAMVVVDGSRTVRLVVAWWFSGRGSGNDTVMNYWREKWIGGEECWMEMVLN